MFYGVFHLVWILFCLSSVPLLFIFNLFCALLLVFFCFILSMQETRESIKVFANDLSSRCLFDPLEFLFKINIIDGFSYTNKPQRVNRAMNLFSMREYFQVFSVLQCRDSPKPTFKLSYSYCSCCDKEEVFLRNYSLYILSSLKGTEETNFMVDKVFYSDNDLDKLLKNIKSFSDFSKVFKSEKFLDPFLVYILVTSKRHHISKDNFKKTIIILVHILPYFWDIYKILSEIITLSDCSEIFSTIKDPLMKRVFILYLGSRKSILNLSLQKIVSDYVKNPKGFSLYEEGLVSSVLSHYKNNNRSLEVMERVLEKTHDWNNMDQFSNILYSLKDSERLSSLLFKVFEQFCNLPIYNYVSGNILALKSDHIKSIEEFQKITNDDVAGEFDIAYIFIAQEYFHLKDTCSAIKACNLAIKKNYNDYRVWLSMAQIYSSIEMHEYSLHFYRKCAELSPNTHSIYDGLGQCFDRLGREEEAVRCYNKSIEQGSMKALWLLGDLLFKQNNRDYVTYYMSYLQLSFQPEDEYHKEISIKTVERLIELLEAKVEASTILGWRRSLTILKDRLGS